MAQTHIAIDVAFLRPGKGGSGGGIATYALSLIQALDVADHRETKLLCFIDKTLMMEIFPKGFQSIKPIPPPFAVNNLIRRIIWTQFVLPLYCLWYRIDILHTVISDRPLAAPSRVIVTLHDFMAEHYRESAF